MSSSMIYLLNMVISMVISLVLPEGKSKKMLAHQKPWYFAINHGIFVGSP